MDVISEVVSSKSAGKIHYAVGQVEAISPDGSRRLLKIGDTVFKNEMIVTGADGVIHIDLVNGQVLELSSGIETDLLPFFADTQVEEIAEEAELTEVQQAILAGADPTELLSAPAAGAPDTNDTDNSGFGRQTILELSGFQGDPEAGFETASLFDGGVTETATVNVGVTPVADIADDDQVETAEDTAVDIDVLANDSFEDSSAKVTAVTQGNNGTVSINPDGTVKYTPNADYNGSDSFTYTVTAGGVTETATVNVGVTPVADIADDDQVETAEDTAVDIDVLANDSFEDSSAKVTAVTQGNNGTVSINPDGTVKYTPNADYNGSDSFTYTVTAGGVTETATVNVGVTPVADIADDDQVDTAEDTAVDIDVLANDSFEDSSAKVTAVTNGTNGTVTINPNGTVKYTPNADYNGADSFTYTVTAGGVTETATVTVNVTPATDIAADQVETAEDTAVDIDVLANDSFEDGSAEVTSVTHGTNGTVIINPNGTVKYTPNADYNGPDSFTYTVTAGGVTETATVNVGVTPVQDLTAGDDSLKVNEDSQNNSGTVAGNDSTTSNGILSYALTSGSDVSNGTLVFSNDGSYTYTPDGNFTGTDGFSYTVTDAASGESSVQTVVITVDPVQDLTAGDDTLKVNEDSGATSGTVASNDSTTSGGTLSYALTSGSTVSNGTLVFSSDGTYTYTPNGNFTGTDGFSYTVTDAASGESSVQTVVITVDPVQDLTAGDDTLKVNEDSGATSGTVASNDSTTSGGTLSYALTSGSTVSHGTLVFSSDGSYTYTPDGNFTGTDGFSYTVTDAASGESSVQTVVITVDPVQDLTAGDDTLKVNEDSGATSGTVASNDSTTSGGTLSYALTSGSTVSHGTLVFSSDGSYTYTPDGNFTGTDGFSYTVTDAASGESSVQTVVITVDPVQDLTAGDDTLKVNEDSGATSGTVASNDSTTSGGTLSYALTSGSTVSNGTLVFSSDGTYTYTPNGNFTGTDGFSYTVTDAASGESSVQTVTITVDPVQDLTAGDDSLKVNEDSQNNSGTVAGNDSTTSNGILSYALTSGSDVSHGTLVFSSDGSYTYTPDGNFTGTDGFSYTVTDAASGESSVQTVVITVDPVQDLTAGDDTLKVNEDSGATSGTVASNDSTTSGGTLSYALTSGSTVSNGTLVFSSDGTYTYTPNGNFTGTDGFSYTVTDAASGESSVQTVVITVDPVQDLTAGDDTLKVNEDSGATSGTVASNDSTTSGGTLSYALTSGSTVSHGTLVFSSDGSYTYTPDGNFTGTDGFSYTVTDAASGESSVQTVVITVDPVQDLTAGDDTLKVNEDSGATSGTVASNDSTTSGGTLSYALTSGSTVSNGTLVFSSDGTYTYTPNGNFTGTDGFSYTVTDAASGESSVQTVVITVDPVQDLTAGDDTLKVNEDSGATSGTVASNDSTTSGGTLSYALTSGSTVSHGTLVFSSDGSYTYTPDGNFTGTDGFSYTVTDAASGESSVQTVVITVDPVQDLTAGDDTLKVNEDSGATSGTVASNDSTTSGGTLSYALTSGSTVSHGTLVFSSDGSYTYTPDGNFTGTDGFSYTVTDAASGESSVQTVVITVDPVQDLTAGDDTLKVNEDSGATSGTVASNDSTTSGGTLSYALTSGSTVSNGTLVFSSDGTYTYTPNGNFTGTDGFSYTVTDAASGESSVQTVTITVDPVQDLTAGDDSLKVNEDSQNNSGTVAGNDSTTSNGILSYALTSGSDVSHGTLVFSSDGSYTYTPDGNFTGTDGFSYTVTDAASGESSVQTVVITVDPVQDLTAGDDTLKVNEDSGATSGTVASNDSTTSGGTLSYALTSGSTVSHGTLVFSSDGSYTYTPDGNFTGTDGFSYTVTDAASGESSVQTVVITVDPVQDLTAGDDSLKVNEDSQNNSGTVAGNDSTTSNGILSYALTSGSDVSHGTLVFSSDGSYTYTPDGNFTGTDGFSYTVTDAASGESSVQTVVITVDPVQDLTAGDDTLKVNEDSGATSGTVASNDSTTSGGTLSYALTSGSTVSNGTLVFSNDGSYTYTPDGNFTGTDGFSYTVTDAASGESSVQTVVITVDPVQDLTAGDDTLKVNEDSGATSGTVAGNDSTTSNGILSYALTSGSDVSHGTLVFSSDGTYTYTPNGNFTGTDGFSYTVTDAASGESSVQTVTITVDPVQDLTTGDDTLKVNEDSGATSGTVASNDSTTSGGTLSYALTSGSTVSNGTLVFSSDGTYTYTPNGNFTGTDGFSYTVTDAASGESSVQTVTITVDPVQDLTAGDDSLKVNEDSQNNSGTVAGNDSTTSNGILSYALTSGSDVSHGTLVFSSDGSYTYTPDGNFTGTDGFSYTVTDAASGESSVQTVVITVDPVQDLTAGDDTLKVNEDSGATSGTVASNDSTTSGGTLSYALTSGSTVSHGTLVFSSDGSYTYTPDGNFTGTDGFSYTVTDAASGESSVQTVVITVDPVQDLTAGDDTLKVNEDSGATSGTVASNDSTTSGGTLSYALTSGSTVSNGTLVFSSDGTYTYTPNGNFTGTDGFSYTVTDAASGESSVQTVTITVDPVQDLTAGDDSLKVNEDSQNNSGTVAGNDSTTSNGILSYALTSGSDVSHGTLVFSSDGSYTYTPDGNFTGTDGFSYTVTDAASGESSVQTVVITVDPVQDLTAGDDTLKVNEDSGATSGTVASNDSTTSGGTLSYALTSGSTVSHGTLVFSSDGSYTYTPDGNFTGTDGFSYTVTDAASGESSVQTVVITVDPVQDLTAGDDSLKVNEDSQNNSGTVAGNDSTTSNGILSYALTSGSDVSHGTLVFSSDGTYTYTPNGNFTGTDGFSYTVTDAASGESSVQTVVITVDPVQDLTAGDDTLKVNEDSGATSGTVASNDSTTSGGTLSYALTSGSNVSNGTLVFSNDGSYTYTPDGNFTGTDGFSYTVTDAASGESSVQTVVITVDPVQDLTAGDDTLKVNEDSGATSGTVASNDSTISGGTLSYALTSGSDVSHGTLVFSNDGSYTYTPDGNFTGTDGFSYTVTDAASGESSVQTVVITVDPVQDLTAGDDTLKVNEDSGATSGTVASNDSTISGGTLSYALTSGSTVSNGTLVFSSDGTYTYTPNGNFTGTDGFSYTVTDAASGESSVQTVTITVDPVQDLTAGDDTLKVNEDSGATSGTVASNDSTTSGGTLSYALTSGSTVSHGTLVFSSDGSYTYTPDGNFTGTDGFSYTVTDAASGESSVQTVTITVQHDPEGENFTVNSSTPVSGDGISIDFTGLVSDVEDDDGAVGIMITELPDAEKGSLFYGNGANQVTDAMLYKVGVNGVVIQEGKHFSQDELIYIPKTGALGFVGDGKEGGHSLEDWGDAFYFYQLGKTDNTVTEDNADDLVGDDLVTNGSIGAKYNGATVSDGSLGTLTLNNDGSYRHGKEGTWEYVVSNDAVQYLNAGEVITEVFTVTKYKANGDVRWTENIEITIKGTDEGYNKSTDVGFKKTFDNGITATITATGGELKVYGNESGEAAIPHLGNGLGVDEGFGDGTEADNAKGINPGEIIKVDFSEPVSYVEVGLDGLGDHFIHVNDASAYVFWTATNSEGAMTSGKIYKSTSGELTQQLFIDSSMTGDKSISSIEFTTVSGKDTSSFEILYIELNSKDNFTYVPVDSDGAVGDEKTVTVNVNPFEFEGTGGIDAFAFSATDLLGGDQTLSITDFSLVQENSDNEADRLDLSKLLDLGDGNVDVDAIVAALTGKLDVSFDDNAQNTIISYSATNNQGEINTLNVLLKDIGQSSWTDQNGNGIDENDVLLQLVNNGQLIV